MNWQQLRQQYPHRWLIVEAINAHTEGSNRIIDQLDVIEIFGDDWKPAWELYKALHNADRYREYYVLHTEALNIGVMDTFGRVL
jgi:hypothetical protein